MYSINCELELSGTISCYNSRPNRPYNDGEITKEATCSEEGEKTYTEETEADAGQEKTENDRDEDTDTQTKAESDRNEDTDTQAKVESMTAEQAMQWLNGKWDAGNGVTYHFSLNADGTLPMPAEGEDWSATPPEHGPAAVIRL